MERADLVLHLTEWREFRALEPAALADVVSRARIVDGRGALDEARWTAAGWSFRALGRPARPPRRGESITERI